MMTRKQLAMIQAAKRQLGLAEDEYRGLLRRMGEVESSRDLTPAGFDALIRAFEVLGFRRTTRPARARPGMATPAQLVLVDQLWRQWAGEDNPAAMRHWLERSFRISAPRFMTADHASKAINALCAMIRRKTVQEVRRKSR